MQHLSSATATALQRPLWQVPFQRSAGYECHPSLERAHLATCHTMSPTTYLSAQELHTQHAPQRICLLLLRQICKTHFDLAAEMVTSTTSQPWELTAEPCSPTPHLLSMQGTTRAKVCACKSSLDASTCASAPALIPLISAQRKALVYCAMAAS